MKKLLMMVYSLISISLVNAQTSTFPPGEYLTERGWGTLEIKPAQQGRQRFDINTVGANGHMCMLDGEIQNGKAFLLEAYDENGCDLSFVAKGTSIDVVINTPEPCRMYCGARAGFNSLYLKPAPGCDTASRARTRKTFKKLYDSKDYAAAERTLAPILQDCKQTLHWLEEGRLRNDLALTQAKQGYGEACEATLQPLVEDAVRSDEAVCERRSDGAYLPPTDCDSYLPIVRATRVNLKWCARAKNGQVK